jgi:Ni,Fe-hydrogenase III large subunit
MFHSRFSDWPIVTRHQGWPRRLAPADGWRALGEALRADDLDLLGLWGDVECVHAAVLERSGAAPCVLSLPVGDGRVPSLGVFHAPAIRLERALQDLHGIEVTALPDPRPWLDHGHWPTRPARDCDRAQAGFEFLPADGPALHQIPVGPVHAGIIEPGHFRFSAHGEMIVRLEQRLGYTHKGVERLLAGCEVRAGHRLAARTSGDSAVAFAWAYSRAVETALGVQVPARATWLRAVMAELERIANHLGDIGAICNDASFALMHNECGMLREQVLRVVDGCFGHRLMMDCLVPGGVTADLDPAGSGRIGRLLDHIDRRMPELIELYDNTASLQDRTVGTGRLGSELAARFACGGVIGRASGRAFDVRCQLPYAPYDVVMPALTVLQEGDVDARVRVRLAEVSASTALIRRLLAGLPTGRSLLCDLPAPAETRESTALVEGFRGDILAYVRVAPDLRIESCHLRDPSWFQWPVLEAAVEGNIVADFPLCNKSFNCSYSGHDL